jgi:hypothetical protein
MSTIVFNPFTQEFDFVGTGGGGGSVNDLTGNDGTLVPPTGNNINIVGSGVVGSGISTAGNIYVSGNAGTSTLTINETKAQFLTNYNSNNVDHAHTPYTATATDYFISGDSTAGILTVVLPAAPTNFRIFVVKDRAGHANAFPITVSAGGTNIDGAATYLIDVNFESASFMYNGSTYETF